MIDAQSLVALGRSVCAPQALHEATSASQFLLSPFYSLGDYAMVFGNLGLFLLFHGMHRFQLYRRNKTFERTTATLYHNNPPPVAKHSNMHDLNPAASGAVASSPLTMITSLPTTTIMRPAVALKFPNHSISLAMLLAPGVVNGGMRGIFSGEVVDTIGGVVGLVAVSLGVWWRWRSGNLRELKPMRFVLWPHHVRRSFIAPWLLPYGQWGPLSLRSTHGRLRGAVRVGCEWLSAQTITVALLVQAVASIPVPTSWCVGLWFVLCGVQLISVMLIVVVRPARAPATDVLQVISLLITATLELIAGLIASHATAIESESPLTVLSLASMVTSVVKSAHTALIFVWEMQQNNQQQQVIGGGAMEGDDGTIGNITSSNRKGARLLPRQDLRDSPPMVSPRESAWSSQLPSLFLLSPIEEDDDDDDDGLEESSSWRSRMKSGTTPAQLLEELIGAVCALHLEAKKETKVSRWE
ncbi:transmembrane protein, putative [Bodo saltans]|uniref:Transmembrane protein, putative n=1 Tax=Bodo saltans TaxID=75058 RepID=A0A0S4J0N9_BODSA|nr:transmembrane protein, putative [Bodo saltans]|eukprot:CUG48015.1 transmembrane protein, putative [Bodo saltans]